MAVWGTPEEIERRNRIQLSVAAYAYEIKDNPLISDHNFDQACLAIQPSISTGHPVLDQFFRTEFHPDTGAWIHHHPELGKVAALYDRLISGKF